MNIEDFVIKKLTEEKNVERRIESFVITGGLRVSDSQLYKVYSKLNLWDRKPIITIDTTIINDKIELRLNIIYDEIKED